MPFVDLSNSYNKNKGKGFDFEANRRLREEQERQRLAQQQSMASVGSLGGSDAGFPTERPPEIKTSLQEKILQFTGGSILGRAAGLGIAQGGTKETTDEIAVGELDMQQRLIHAIRKNRAEGKDTTRLVNSLKELTGGSTDYNDLFTEGITGKQVVGDAAQLALTAGTFGNLSNAGRLGNVASKINAVGEFGKATRFGKVLNPVVKGAALGYGYDVTEGLKSNQGIGESLKPGTGTITGASIPIITKALGGILKKGLGLSTGVKQPVIERAVSRPSQVNQAIKTYGDEASQQGLVERVKAALQDFVEFRNTEFADSVANMTAKKSIPKSVVVDSFIKEVGRFGGKIKGGSLTFGDTALNRAEQKQIANVWDVLTSWKDMTPKGLDTLRQRIGNEMDNFALANNGRDSVVLGNVKKALTDVMTKNIPGYGKTLSTYGERSRLVRDLSKELSVSGNAKPSTQLNSVMRVFKKDPSVIEGLRTILGNEQAEMLLDDIAGAQLSQWFQPGLTGIIREGGITLAGIYGLVTGGIGIPTAAVGIATASPKIVGKSAIAVGKAIKSGVTGTVKKATTIGAAKLGN